MARVTEFNGFPDEPTGDSILAEDWMTTLDSEEHRIQPLAEKPVIDQIPPFKEIDAAKLDAWIQMNTVHQGNPSPGAPFIYLDDLMMGFKGDRLEPWGVGNLGANWWRKPTFPPADKWDDIPPDLSMSLVGETIDKTRSRRKFTWVT